MKISGRSRTRGALDLAIDSMESQWTRVEPGGGTEVSSTIILER